MAVPLNRDVLFALPEEVSKKPVRDLFRASVTQREAWFEDTKHNLQVCLYNPTKVSSCYSGELYKVVFTRLESSWIAGPVVQSICTN